MWRNVKPGEKLTTVIDGYVEHEIELDETKVAAQNVIKNEYYAIPKDVLAKNTSSPIQSLIMTCMFRKEM